MSDRKAIEDEISSWLHGMSEHAGSEKERDLMVMIAGMIENGEYRLPDGEEV